MPPLLKSLNVLDTIGQPFQHIFHTTGHLQFFCHRSAKWPSVLGQKHRAPGMGRHDAVCAIPAYEKTESHRYRTNKESAAAAHVFLANRHKQLHQMESISIADAQDINQEAIVASANCYPIENLDQKCSKKKPQGANALQRTADLTQCLFPIDHRCNSGMSHYFLF